MRGDERVCRLSLMSYILAVVFTRDSFKSLSFVVGFLTGFLPGFLSGFLLQRLQNRRQKALDLCERVFRPLHRQLSDARIEMGVNGKANSADPSFWLRLEADGFTEHIKSKLRQDLRDLFTVVFPAYDRSWTELNNRAIPAIRERWDNQFGTPSGSALIRDVDWQRVALEDNYEMPSHPLGTAIDGQRPHEVLRLWNSVVTRQQLDGMPGGLWEFLQTRQNELRELPETRSYLEKRAEAIRRCTISLLEIKQKLIH